MAKTDRCGTAERSSERRDIFRNTGRRRLFEIVEIGYVGDPVSRFYDFFSAAVVVLNLTVSILYTFPQIREAAGGILLLLEGLTVIFFAADFFCRLITADGLYPGKKLPAAMLKYLCSFTGIVDILSFLPYCLPVFFPSGAVAFRMFRVVRIFRLFRINTYYDSLNVITAVIAGKRQQLISSVFIIFILMLASSLCMYSLEAKAQPEVFVNAFSGIWWAASTLLTVGYGDIYPVTTLGKLFGICISFLGVGMVAIPTGIISAGFVEQYTKLKQLGDEASEEELRFIKLRIGHKDPWTGKELSALELPKALLVAAVRRGGEILVPNGNLVVKEGDVLLLGTAGSADIGNIALRKVVLKHRNPWNGARIRDLDISRQTLIVMVRRAGRAVVPHGDLVLQEGDTVLLCTKEHLPDAETAEI